MNNEIFKIGPVELRRKEAKEIYHGKKYMMTSTAVYQMFFSQASNVYYGHRVYWKRDAKFVKPGRFVTATGDEVNRIIGFPLLENL